MPKKISKEKLEKLWDKIDKGKATDQERMDAAWMPGELYAYEYIPKLMKLLKDKNGIVRYNALNSLVLRLDKKDEEIAKICWELFYKDPDIDVRHCAMSCIGSICSNSKDYEILKKLIELLKKKYSNYIREGINDSIYAVMGIIADSMLEFDKEWTSKDIDWEQILKFEEECRK